LTSKKSNLFFYKVFAVLHDALIAPQVLEPTTIGTSWMGTREGRERGGGLFRLQGYIEAERSHGNDIWYRSDVEMGLRLGGLCAAWTEREKT
jgi:hypothetical protein